jgi:hypothetical protein
MDKYYGDNDELEGLVGSVWLEALKQHFGLTSETRFYRVAPTADHMYHIDDDMLSTTPRYTGELEPLRMPENDIVMYGAYLSEDDLLILAFED